MTTKSGKRFVILHGLSANSNSDWYQGVARHLERNGSEVLIPNLPGSYAPNLNRWAAAIHRELKNKGWQIDGDLCLIGHSTGVMAAMRFVEGLPLGTKIGPTIFVAGFPVSLFHPSLPVFVARKPRPNLIKHKIPRLLAIHSTNDWRVPISPNRKWFEQELNAQICVINRAGHFIKRHGWTDWNDELYKTADEFLGLS